MSDAFTVRILADVLSEMCMFVGRSQFAVNSVPQDVLDVLLLSKPERVRERAWLVMFYSIALSTLEGSEPSAHTVRLRSNLWLAFNDVRFLLEPSLLSIQAIVTMTLHAEKYLAPYACWALISKACTMLIALGIGKRPKLPIAYVWTHLKTHRDTFSRRSCHEETT